MTYNEFQEWVEKNCMYEAFYKDSEGRIILVDRKSTRLNSSH